MYTKSNPGSSSGRTKDSGSFNGGSNPSPGVFTPKQDLLGGVVRMSDNFAITK